MKQQEIKSLLQPAWQADYQRAIVNPRTGRPAGTPPEIVAPPGSLPAAPSERPASSIQPNNLRSTRDWQKLFADLQSRVREHFLVAFREDLRTEMETRLYWLVHMITFDELGVKLADDLEIRESNVFLYGWPVLPTAGLIPGAVRVDFVVLAARSTPEFQAWMDKQREKSKALTSAVAEKVKPDGPIPPP